MVFLQDQIKAYLLSHAHFDHTTGLIINSVEDSSEGKQIIGLPTTLDNFQQHVFNGKTWADFGPNGLKKYSFVNVSNSNWIPIANTILQFKAFPVYHGYPYLSTAYLIRDGESFLLYFGDLGPEEVEDKKVTPPDSKGLLTRVWEEVAPLICNQSLSAIFIENSYPNGRPENLLFGHLTPEWLYKELLSLQSLLPCNKTLKGTNIIITHMKPVLGEDIPTLIKVQLHALNTNLSVRFIFPTQGLPFKVCPTSYTLLSISFMNWFEINKLYVFIACGVVIAILIGSFVSLWIFLH